jgi:hypothetical protein
MPKDKKSCPHCGASMVEYRHGLSKALVEGLVRLHKQGKPVNLSVLELTRNQWDNFQKLRYWDLVAHYTDKEGIRKGGVWTITQKGLDFVQGRIRIPRSVWTYRGERVRYEGKEIAIWNVHEGYGYMADYAETAKPRFPGGLRTTPGQELIWPESGKTG